jgi:hypothetical protein
MSENWALVITGFLHGSKYDLQNRDSVNFNMSVIMIYKIANPLILTMAAYRATSYETAEKKRKQEGAVRVRSEAEHFWM